jgi:cyclopropane fatty-acyl-phospholipid synthase-like methyltransferase
MNKGCAVLDLFSGDGFYSRYFYSTIAGSIDAVDNDPHAIAHAKRWHSHPKISYTVLDPLKQDFPRPRYDIIVWFESIEHLTNSEYAVIISRIKTAMGEKSIVIGSTPIISEDCEGESNWQHKNEFSNTKQLREFLCRDFGNVQIDVTVYPVLDNGQRRTAYFYLREPK